MHTRALSLRPRHSVDRFGSGEGRPVDGIPPAPHATGRIDASGVWGLPRHGRRGPGAGARIDPSGGVRDAGMGEPVPGARVTLWCRPLEGADPEPWDASPCGQQNPLVTDARGSFSWDVPEGWWQVRAEAEGYRSAQSEWMRMPAATEPDLQIGLRPASLPQPGGAACADCPVAPDLSARLGRVA